MAADTTITREYYVSKPIHDATVRELSNANKRMLIVIIVLALFLALSNAWWFNYEMQFADETWTYETIYETDNELPF